MKHTARHHWPIRQRREGTSSARFTLAPFLILLLLAVPALHAQFSTDQLLASPEKLYQYAQGLLERDFHEMALDNFNKYIKAYPQGNELQAAWLGRITCLEKLDRSDEMLAEINRFRKQFPQSPFNDSLSVRAAEALLAANRRQDAIPFLDELLKSTSEHVREYAAFTKGKALFALGNEPEARKVFEELSGKKLTAGHPYRAYAAGEYAFFLVREKQPEKALALYQALEKSPDTPAELREYAIFNQVKCHRMLKQLDQALKTVELFIVNHPGSALQPEARKTRILISAEKELYPQTIQCCEDWEKRYPTPSDYEVDYTHAFALMQCKRYDEALPFFERCASVPKCPKHTVLNARYFSVFCLMQASHHAEAVRAADTFLSLYPKSTLVGHVLRWKALALEKQQRLPEAADAFRKALGFFSETPEEYINVAECLIALHSRERQWKQAAAVYRRMSGNHLLKRPFQYLLHSADMELRAGDAEDAFADLKKAMEGNDAETAQTAHLRLAELMMEIGQYPEALSQYRILSKTAKKELLADIQCRIALCLFNMKDYAQAQSVLETALKNSHLKGEKRRYAEFMLVRFLLASGKEAQVIPVVTSLLKAPKESVPFLDANILFLAADACKNQDMPEQLLACLKRITELPNTAEENKVRAQLRIASDIMLPRKQFKPVAEQLKALLEKLQGQPERFQLERTEAASILAETYLKMNQPDLALIYADRALSSPDNDETSHARALYVRAYIALHVEQRYDAANQYATQGYILLNHPQYTPLMMEISIRAFLGMKNRNMALSVLKELRTRYPAFLAQHPEISALIP